MAVKKVRVQFYDESNDLSETSFHVATDATGGEITAMLDAMAGLSALELRSYDVTTELDVSAVVPAGRPAALADEPYADDKFKLVIEMQAADGSKVAKTSIPGPMLTGTGIEIGNNGRVAVPGTGLWSDALDALTANAKTPGGNAFSGPRRAYIDIQRGKRGLG